MTYTAKTNWTAADGVSAADLNRIEQGIVDINASALPATSYTAADVLAKIVTVDGSGSGLDADFLDGLDSLSFVKANGTVPMTGSLNIALANGGIELGSTNATNTPFVDFHSSGNNIDYDARIIGSGGNGTAGNGVLNLIANGGVQINNTTLAATRNNAGTIEWWDGSTWRAVGGVKNIQRGTTIVSSSPMNVTISAVNLSKAYVNFPTNVGNITGSSSAMGCLTAQLTSTTNLQFNATNLGVSPTVSWEIIESY